MSTSPSIALGTDLRQILEQGTPLPPWDLQAMAQALELQDPLELPEQAAAAEMAVLQDRLEAASDEGDAEAMVMRELALFPDTALRRQAEALALEHGASQAQGFDPDELVAQLTGAEALLQCPRPDAAPLELCLLLDAADARQLATRLRLQREIPEEVARALTGTRDDLGEDAFLDMRARCRGARITWGAKQLRFIAALLEGSTTAPRCRKRLREVLGWALDFAPLAGEDIPRAMAERREELGRQLEMAKEVDTVRDTHNFETRRMLGIVEPHLDVEAVREERQLLDLAIVATGWGAMPLRPQVMQQDLGELESVEDMQALMRSLGLFGEE